ncbi:hypothetical protein Tco_1090195 [Tanacetum coccineum]|uniref:Uncharacterized protein n=1 Tax=Tanacetum coccineum TaxID=301880 RepID=A0ABQ5I555_9ASTR
MDTAYKSLFFVVSCEAQAQIRRIFLDGYGVYIPNLGVQQGVNFMASLQDFSTTPTAFTDPFGVFRTPGAGPSTSHNFRNDMDEE